ncbi:hypothetical protein J604_4112, partial [Acinetobacter sp. 694762]
MCLKFEWIGENSAFECLCNKAIQGYHESPVRLVLKEIGDIERVLSRVAL